MGKVWWVHVRQKVEPSFVAGVGVTVARARSFTPVLFLLPRSLHDSLGVASLFSLLLSRSRAIFPPAARVQILPTLPTPLSPSSLSSLFSFSPRTFFSPFFSPSSSLSSRVHSHSVQHLSSYTPPQRASPPIQPLLLFPPLSLSFSMILLSYISLLLTLAFFFS